MMTHFAYWCFILHLLSFSTLGKRFQPTWESLDTHVAPAWYDEAKLGIFMHWGLYSVPSYGTEWFWERWKGNINLLAMFFTVIIFGSAQKFSCFTFGGCLE